MNPIRSVCGACSRVHHDVQCLRPARKPAPGTQHILARSLTAGTKRKRKRKRKRCKAQRNPPQPDTYAPDPTEAYPRLWPHSGLSGSLWAKTWHRSSVKEAQYCTGSKTSIAAHFMAVAEIALGEVRGGVTVSLTGGLNTFLSLHTRR